MSTSRGTKIALSIFAIIVFGFVYVPLSVVLINSFNAGETLSWPPSGLSIQWWQRAIDNEGVREAIITSVILGLIATAIALVLGTLASLALSRFRFFGQDAISLLIILPIALPGIVTGIALNNVFTSYLGGLTFLTLIIGHATFTIVVIYNNALARLRRTGSNLDDASADLGAGPWTTFRLVTFPLMRSALIAGSVLAFGLSFDEIIVTTFTAGPGITTLPIWIYQNLFRPTQAPIVNVVAAALVLVSILPIYVAQKLSSDSERGGGIM
ncbi:spermidine/putrescine ABC transporter permease [Actinomycetes bacterium]|nr:spermidine/putrescine ABC transporter permease [Actinomycetes bacterium]